jgi:biotin carboxyl carrier protein
MTGVVKEIMVALGDSVKEGEKILIMEAMKMDIEVTAVRGGRVSAVLVKSNDNIKEGQPLIRIG